MILLDGAMLSVGNSISKWPVTASKSEKMGYNETFCIKCNGA